MVTVKNYSELLRKDVFTSKGSYCGKVSDVSLDLEKFRLKAMVVDTVKGSFLSNMIGDKKGVIVPFQMIQAIGDIILIKHVSPTQQENGEEEPEPEVMKK